MSTTAPALGARSRRRRDGSWRRWTSRNRIATLIVLASLAISVWYARRLSLLPTFVLWGCWLAGAVIYLRRCRVKFFGPVCFHDLVRTGRQTRYNLIRCAYVAVLFVTLAVVYAGWFIEHGGSVVTLFHGGVLDGQDMAWFAETFFLNFAWVQFVIACLLTPIYVGSSLTEEKERKTLDGVLTSDLEDQEIILGKLASRLAHLLLVLGAGLPVLALTQLFGGVAPELVLACFLVTAITVVSLGSLSILCSVYARQTANAVLSTYFWAVGFLAVTGLIYGTIALVNNYFIGMLLPMIFDLLLGWSMPDWFGPLPLLNFGNPMIALGEFVVGLSRFQSFFDVLQEVLTEYAIFHVLITVFCCTWAVRKLRPVGLRIDEPLPIWRRTGVEFPPRLQRPKLGKWPPLLWKEVHADAPVGSHRFSALLMYLQLVLGWFFVVVFVVGVWVSAGFRDIDDFEWPVVASQANGYVRALGPFLASVMLLAVAGYAAGSVCRERERQTLDGLLTLPVERSDILFAKWLGAPLAVRPIWWCLGIIWGVGTLLGGLHFLSLPLLVLAWWIYALFLSGLGMWFSVRTNSTLRASVWTLMTILGLVLAFRLIGSNPHLFFGWLSRESAEEVGRWFDLGLMPPAALTVMSFGYGDFLQRPRGAGASWENLRAALIGLPLTAAAAWALWRSNRRRFGRH